MPLRLGVIGAGPKGVGIATKAAALARAGYDAPAVTLVDRAGVGAAWRGRNGYTDGHALLCTPVDRDLGYPYEHGSYGPEVAREMLDAYSFTSFMASAKNRYASWINRGRPQPDHETWSTYLSHAMGSCGATLVIGEATGFSYDAATAQWTLSLADGGRPKFDGLVVTGSGPSLPPLPGADPGVLDGVNFWDDAEAVLRRLHGRDDACCVVIGNGGTAGAVCAWLLRHVRGRVPVIMVGRSAAPVTRTASYFTDRLFGDDARWERLTDVQRNDFLQRVGSGFLWEQAGRVLERDRRFEYLEGEASDFVPRNGSLAVRVLVGKARVRIPATLVVDCRGFDARWFTPLLHDPVYAAWRTTGTGGVDDSFALGAPFPHPRFHVPALGTSIGPGAGNLLALGWVSDHIMREYVTPR